MVKLLIETGSGKHTTSSASASAKFVDGPYNGKHLYEMKKEFQSGKAEWDTSVTNERWVTTVYDLPNGTQVAFIGNGRTGNLGSNKHAFHKIYRIDETAEILEGQIDTGLRRCDFKGRLVFLRDVLEEQEQAERVNKEEGF